MIRIPLPHSLPITILVLILGVAGCGGGSSVTPAPPPDSNPVPSATSVTPSSTVAGSADTPITITGSGFVSSSTVQWNGTPIVTTFSSATKLNATVASSLLTGGAVAHLTVVNPAPGGGTSAPLDFSINAPVPAITSISPSTVATGHAATITITGSGFEANSVVQWNNSPRPTTAVSTTQLKVDLTAADLQTQGTGSLSVNNPGPTSSTSPVAPLIVSSQPIPQIQSVTIAPASGASGCTPLQATITGQNIDFLSQVQANGQLLQSFAPGPANTIVGILPANFVSAPGALAFTVTNPGSPQPVSDSFPYPTTSPAAFTLCANPSPTTVFVGAAFSFKIQPSEVNVPGNISVTLGALPAGITTATTNVAVPPTGALVHFASTNTTAAGTYDLALNGSSGSATGKGDFNFTVSTAAPPSFFFINPLFNELAIPIGGSGSLRFSSDVNSTASVDFDVTPSIANLPPGTTASFAPSVFTVRQDVTVTLTASSSAPITQNASLTLTGTPSAQAPPASVNFFADVTSPPGSLSDSRTDYVSTAGTPYAATFDSTHNLIFSSNPDWNRVDVIDNSTHKIIKQIPVRSPRGIDITQDHAHVWVQTASPNLYSIDTVTLQASHFQLPDGTIASTGLPTLFFGDRLLALSDGTLFVFFADGGSSTQAGIFDPQNNSLHVLANGNPSAWGFPARSGDGTLVYAPNGAPGSGLEIYSVSSRSLSNIGQGANLQPVIAVNQNGSRLILGSNTLHLYDSQLTDLGPLPGVLPGFGGNSPLSGGALFSRDGSKVYQNAIYDNLNLVLTIDASTLQLLGTAPSGFAESVNVGGVFGNATPFAIDSTSIILGLQNYGITFDDATYFQHYSSTNQPGQNGISGSPDPSAGPLAGGTAAHLGLFTNLTPDVWFGQKRATVTAAQNAVTAVSPPGTAPGPVNVKLIFPDGVQAFDPLAFTYSTFPEYAITSGSSPDGGATGKLLGTGLPSDSSGGSLKIGANAASIIAPANNIVPLGGEPVFSTILTYTFPAGSPGRADIQVTTPNGTGTLPQAVLYAKSVTDYASSDTFAAALLDASRKQLYLSAGDHVDVFSTTTNQFLTALHPAAKGSQSLFAGLALTPDGQLLAANILDSSLAVIDPDTPSNTFAIAIPPGIPANCPVGPVYVAATSNHQAFVSLGPAGCGSGPAYIANLQTRGATVSACGATGLDATADGNFVILGDGHPCIYSVQSNAYVQGAFPYIPTSVAVAGDGNVFAASQVFGDLNARMLGSVAQPTPLYGNASPGSPAVPAGLMFRTRLNASGSLYFESFPDHFDVIDVQHAALRLRFALTQKIVDSVQPLTIDSGGRFIYLLTDKGLTVVDLGSAPLSIGHLSAQNAAPGSQVTVRGSGFASGMTAKVGKVSAAVSVSDENTLTLTVPAAASGPQDIVLTLVGGQTYTLENGIVLP